MLYKSLGLFSIFQNMVKGATFGKVEKLKSRKEIDALFQTGRSLAQFPLRVRYAMAPAAEAEAGAQAGFTVSKKHFKRAVDRNRIKRLLREAYRLQKAPLLQTLMAQQQRLHLFFMHTDKTLPDFETLYAAVGRCLQALQQKISTPHEKAG